MNENRVYFFSSCIDTIITILNVKSLLPVIILEPETTVLNFYIQALFCLLKDLSFHVCVTEEYDSVTVKQVNSIKLCINRHQKGL